jgi:predicted  nucleic acid-binding Zn-ribbon protein
MVRTLLSLSLLSACQDAELQAQVDALSAELEATQARVETLESASLPGSIAALDTRVKALEDAGFLDAAALEELGLRDDLDALALANQEVEAGLAAVEGRVDAAEATLATHTSDLTKQQTAITALEGTQRTHATTLSDHGSRVGALETTSALYGTSLSTHTGQISALTKDLDAAELEIGSLKTRATKTESDAAALTTRTSKLETDATALTTRVKTAEDDLVDLDDRLGTSETDIAALESRMDDEEDLSLELLAYADWHFFQGSGRSDADSGVLSTHKLTFTKALADSQILVTWYDNFRVYNPSAGRTCQWEVLIDGNSCKTPGKILADEHVGYDNNNTHHPATVTSVCSETTAGAIGAGSHTLTVRINGAVSGHSAGDCWTGWYDQHIMLAAREIPK